MPKHLHPGLQDPELLQHVVPVGAPGAAICHAIWMLVEADAVRDRTLTSWPSLQTDVRNAGGTWVDQEVVTDGSLVTSRKPDDLPAFNAAMLDVLGAVG
ncbi:DJ-1/PfpI family protein [Janibacter sp. YB324]|uniref:DJ-1/PfpI family protein n=1 Tax=Janibacter sp. YB324 TaxID=2761047 RepID=UPI0016234C33|nr:DJ-1/PfpI family protein [Janibacter sp. YB324]